MVRARLIASAEVHGAAQSSTSGTRCGGLTGWPTRQRARPGSVSVKREATIAEVEETSSASGRASLSSWAKIARLSSTFSGPFSWTNSTSITASLRLPATEIRATAPLGSSANPWRASACNSSRIRRGAAFSVGICGSLSRTCHPARAKIAAQARPIRPVPTMATCRSVLAIFISRIRCSQPVHLAAQIEIVPQGPGRPLVNHPAALQRHRGVGQCQRQIEIVIDDDDGDFLAQAIEGFEQLLDHGRRQALKRLIEQQYPHVAGQRAGHRHHLLLSAGEIVGGTVEPLTNAREIFVDALARPVHAVAGLPLQPAELEILLDAHAGEQAAALRHIADAAPRVLRRRSANQFVLGKSDRSVRSRRDADQGFQQRRLAGAVAPE